MILVISCDEIALSSTVLLNTISRMRTVNYLNWFGIKQLLNISKTIVTGQCIKIKSKIHFYIKVKSLLSVTLCGSLTKVRLMPKSKSKMTKSRCI